VAPMTKVTNDSNSTSESASAVNHDDDECSNGVKLGVVRKSYGWTLDNEGQVLGLIAGDMGFESTGITLDKETVEIWKQGILASSDLADESDSGNAIADLDIPDSLGWIKQLDGYGTNTKDDDTFFVSAPGGQYVLRDDVSKAAAQAHAITRFELLEEAATICDHQSDKARTSPGALRAAVCAERIRALQNGNGTKMISNIPVDPEILYRAWHHVGADVAGLRFEDFMQALSQLPNKPSNNPAE